MKHNTTRAATYAALKLLQSRGRWADIMLITELASDALGTRQPDGSISRRMRELRQPRFGGHVVKCELQQDGVYRYMLMGKNE
jgi:hypothetical protein